jgi:hypothetical protein
LHVYLKNKSLEEQKKFLEYIDRYESSEIWKIDGKNIDFNINEEFERCLKENFKEIKISFEELKKSKIFDITELYDLKRKSFEEKVKASDGIDYENITEFLEDHKQNSLLFFDNEDSLVNEFIDKFKKNNHSDTIAPKQIRLNNKDLVQSDIINIKKEIEEDISKNDYKIINAQITKPIILAKEKNPKTSNINSRTFKPSENTDSIGLIGELYIFNLLKKEKNIDNLEWVSGNAKKAGNNPLGDDTKGYDISYNDSNNMKKYIEVKSSSGDNQSFTMSRNEVEVAENRKEDYEIIIVLNALEKERKPINLGAIFNFDEGETFNKNSSFIVENENYKIKFKCLE